MDGMYLYIDFATNYQKSLSFFVFWLYIYMDASKNRGKKPKMDGENNGKPY